VCEHSNESYGAVSRVCLNYGAIQFKVVLICKSVAKTLVCDHSNESYWPVLSCGTVNYAVQGGSNF